LKARLGGLDGPVDVLAVAFGHGGQHLAGGRVQGVEGFA